jgi:hypothetical protein
MTFGLVREPANGLVKIKEASMREHPSRGLTCWGRSELCEGEQQILGVRAAMHYFWHIK